MAINHTRTYVSQTAVCGHLLTLRLDVAVEPPDTIWCSDCKARVRVPRFILPEGYSCTIDESAGVREDAETR